MDNHLHLRVYRTLSLAALRRRPCRGPSPLPAVRARGARRRANSQRRSSAMSNSATRNFVRGRTAANACAEIPRAQREPVRCSLESLFEQDLQDTIARAYREQGYSLRELAAVLGVHYSAVIRRLRCEEARTAACCTARPDPEPRGNHCPSRPGSRRSRSGTAGTALPRGRPAAGRRTMRARSDHVRGPRATAPPLDPPPARHAATRTEHRARPSHRPPLTRAHPSGTRAST